MKLYIWNDPYSVSYGGACIYAVAETVEEARELASRAPISEFGFEPDVRPFGCGDKLELGDPTPGSFLFRTPNATSGQND